MLFFKLVLLVFSFFIFHDLLDLPFVASAPWTILCGFGVTFLFFILLFCFNDLKGNIRVKIANVRARGVSANILFFSDLLFNSLFVAFFIFVFSTYFTMYFAKIPFTENVTVIRLKCFDHHAPLPSYTHVRFEDDATHVRYTLTFRDNVCVEKPDIANQLPGKKAELSGKQSFFGKFYNTIVAK